MTNGLQGIGTKLTTPAGKYGRFYANTIVYNHTCIPDSGIWNIDRPLSGIVAHLCINQCRIDSPPLVNNKPAAFNIVGQAQKVNTMKEKRLWQIVQWGEVKYTGTKMDCLLTKKRWEEKCGNVDLIIRKSPLPANSPSEGKG